MYHEDIEAWMLINSFKLNGDKTEVLIIGIHQQCRELSNISINVGGSVIEACEKARNLGVVFDTNLTLKSHRHAIDSGELKSAKPCSRILLNFMQ